MTKYRVYLTAVVSTSVEVEADSGDEATDAAFKVALPGLNISNEGIDMGEWTLASELFPQFNKPEDDYEVIE